MARPTKFTPDVLKTVKKLRAEGMPYKSIANVLQTAYGITTTAGSLKVKMATDSDTTVQKQIDSLQSQLAELQQQLHPPIEPDLRQKILNHMNGQWYTYKQLSQAVLGTPFHHQRVRWVVNKIPDGLIEKTTTNHRVMIRKVKQ